MTHICEKCGIVVDDEATHPHICPADNKITVEIHCGFCSDSIVMDKFIYHPGYVMQQFTVEHIFGKPICRGCQQRAAYCLMHAPVKEVDHETIQKLFLDNGFTL